jgi:hypothetical protein
MLILFSSKLDLVKPRCGVSDFLENHNIGISIGNTYAGCLTCADEIVLLSLNNNERLSSVVIINSISFAVMLEQTSLSIRAAIFRESPSVNPNCMFD